MNRDKMNIDALIVSIWGRMYTEMHKIEINRAAKKGIRKISD